MFTAIMKNGEKIPLEDWIILLWLKDRLTDPACLRIIKGAKTIRGNWKTMREASLLASTGGKPIHLWELPEQE